MKALSLWQPWATLYITGAKEHETRSWETLHRGPVAIHAAQHWSRDLEMRCYREHFLDALSDLPKSDGENFGDVLPFGCIIGVVDIVGCVRIDASTTPADARERAFGDYTPGRFRWDRVNPRPLSTPIPCRGRQRLFNLPDDIAAEVMRQLEEAF